ncbi:enoyl-CoA hydratase/isomerase family protein [Corynebacterium hindlerae]|uniref:enoyl-CoA hydratase/isomerase family protein n=1 Tax=Corynebacterium hindlerae TaxID=699041 RepID=UPI003AADD6B5
MTTPEVLTETRASTGVLTLNRPKALNALDPEMVRIITEQLEEWRDDPEVHRVIITSNSEKGFCAGGDIKVVREKAVEGNHEFGDQFLQAEYTMNAMIANFPKPYVAIIDGVVMGGGLGVSAHGSHRVISEKAFAAMPEVAIGFVPDVGVSWMSTHVDSQEGRPLPAVAKFAGVTGYRLTAADMLYTGLATHYVPHEDMQQFTEMLIAESLDEALEKYAADLEEESFLKANLAVIEECFGHDTWADIEEALSKADKEFADLVWDLLSAGNPASMVATVELYTANEEADSVEKGLHNEYAIGSVLRRQPNFVEGVRAVLVDKDRNPTFVPDKPSDVDPIQFRSVLS